MAAFFSVDGATVKPCPITWPSDRRRDCLFVSLRERVAILWRNRQNVLTRVLGCHRPGVRGNERVL
jgi:hypothetical protein